MTDSTTNRTETGHWARFNEALKAATTPLREDMEWLAGEHEQLRAENERLKREASQEQELRDQFVNDLLENAGDEWDDDVSAEEIALRYLRHHEAQLAVAYDVIRRLLAGQEISQTVRGLEWWGGAPGSDTPTAVTPEQASVLDAVAGPNDTEENRDDD